MNREAFLEKAKASGFQITAEQLERFVIYSDTLAEFNSKMDITAVTEEDEWLDRHFIDSIIALNMIPFGEKSKVIDVGTGGGFPGIPLLIMRPDIQMTLLDAQQKRTVFLDACLKRMGLTANVMHSRAEDAARQPACREQYDLAVSRAVAATPVLMELMIPFVKVGGCAVAWKGPGIYEEIPAVTKASRILGGEAPEILKASIPGREEWQHVLLVIKKEHSTIKKYPRKAGIPGKQPLA